MSKARILAISTLLFLLCQTSAVFAKQEVTNELFNPKPATPSRLFSAELSIPEKFNTTNNLIQKTGSFYAAFGEMLFVQGTITDSFSVPIEGAIIEIWQTNSAGKYQTLLDNSSDFIDKNFNMSGRTITDNLGKYFFVTIVPGSYLNRAPHINFNIYHQKFGKLETEMYFENHPKNNSDYEYLSYSQEDQKLITAKVNLTDIFNSKSTKIATFDIVMKGVHQYKRFGN